MAVVAVASPVASVDKVFARRIGLHAELRTMPDRHGLLLLSEVLRSETNRAAAIFVYELYVTKQQYNPMAITNTKSNCYMGWLLTQFAELAV